MFLSNVSHFTSYVQCLMFHYTGISHFASSLSFFCSFISSHNGLPLFQKTKKYTLTCDFLRIVLSPLTDGDCSLYKSTPESSCKSPSAITLNHVEPQSLAPSLCALHFLSILCIVSLTLIISSKKAP